MIHNRRGDVYIRGVLQVCNRLICRVCAQESSLNVLLSLVLQKNKRATLLKLNTSLSKIGSLEYSMFESISFEPNYLNTYTRTADPTYRSQWSWGLHWPVSWGPDLTRASPLA